MERVYTTPRLDKLGVKPGSRVALVGLEDPAFETELRDRTSDITHGEPLPDTDLVFLAADDHAALAALPRLRERIRPNGAIWVISRKGKAATLRDVEVIAAAIAERPRRQQGRVASTRRGPRPGSSSRSRCAAAAEAGTAAGLRPSTPGGPNRADCYHPRIWTSSSSSSSS